jgi:hypothetical protein
MNYEVLMLMLVLIRLGYSAVQETFLAGLVLQVLYIVDILSTHHRSWQVWSDEIIVRTPHGNRILTCSTTLHKLTHLYI